MRDLANAIDDAAGIMPTDPILAAITATTTFALALFGLPADEGRDAHAMLFGLRGGDSLRPWIEEGVNEVEELARLDFEHEHGDGWRAEWERRLDEVFALMDGRLGADWLACV